MTLKPRTKPEASAPSAPRADAILSERLEEFLGRLLEGISPNAGIFCSFCYNPLPRKFKSCDHCGQDLEKGSALKALPSAVLQMYRRKLRTESLIVNSFAYLGLALGLALYLGLVAINVLYLEKALWFFVIATVIFLFSSRMLAGLIGGYIGDELGYRVAKRHLAEDWAAHLSQRESERDS